MCRHLRRGRGHWIALLDGGDRNEEQRLKREDEELGVGARDRRVLKLSEITF